jgi:hypothetical protein
MNTKKSYKRPCTANRVRSTFPPNASRTALNLLFYATMEICDKYDLLGSERIRLV